MPRVFRNIAALAIVAVFALVHAACGGASGGGGGKDVAATVNGKKITLSEVDQHHQPADRGQQASLTPLQLATARLQALDSLIQQEVLFQRAEKDKLLPTDDEVTQAINEQKRQNNLTEEEYQKMLKDSGQTEKDLRDVARRQLAIQKLLEKTVAGVTVSNTEVGLVLQQQQGAVRQPARRGTGDDRRRPFRQRGPVPGRCEERPGGEGED